jgi:hypothetical protein
MTAEERAKALCYGDDTVCEHTSTGLACHDCILAALRSAEREAAAELEFYRDREKHIAALLKVADGGQYRADWNGAVERLKREAAQRAYEDAEDVLQRFISKQNHRAMTVYDATDLMIKEMRLRASSSPEGSR